MTLYQLVRPLASLAFRTYFSKIYLVNLENLPMDKPVILAVNHPTAFLEPCALATLLPRKLFYLARGDLFKKPLFNWLLRSLHILPIFRMRDGFSSLKQNSKTFDDCYDALAEHKLIMILVEGSTKEVFKLRPLQKGAARIAFGAIEKTPELDVHIVPLGVTFTKPNSFRSQAYFSIGKPLKVLDYWDDYQANPQNTVRELTLDLGNELRDRLIHIDKDQDAFLTEGLMEMYQNSENRIGLKVLFKESSSLAAQMEIAKNVGQFEETAKKEWEEQLKDYRRLLSKYRLTDLSVARKDAYHILNTILLVIGFLPFVLGTAVNFLPAFLAHTISLKKVYQREFFSGVRIALAIFFYLLYYLLITLVGSFSLGWLIIPVALALALSIHPAILYYDLFRHWNHARKFFSLPASIRQELIKKREDLLI